MKSITFELRTNASRDYIMLSGLMHWFEPDILGGKNKSHKAKSMATVQYGDNPPVLDDIDASKSIFRSRRKCLARCFLDDHGLSNGDLITLERTAPYAYRFTKG